MEKIKVFVYGTLMQGFCNHWLIKDHIKDIKVGQVSAKLYHLPEGYPAITLGEGIVAGELLTLDKPNEALIKLDELEYYHEECSDHNLYERVEVMVTTGSGTERAYCYVWPEKNRHYLTTAAIFVPEGDWKKFMLR